MATKQSFLLSCALAGAALTFGGCAGNGMGLDQSGRPLPAGGGGDGAQTADFASIQQHVLTPICTVCHAGAAAPQGLRLDASNSYALLVGIPSTEVPSILRVKPGDPDNSYLIQKLEGHAAVGARMPFGGPYLDAATIAIIRQWITDGAQRPAAAASRGFSVGTVVPAPDDMLVDAPTRLVIEFDGELDQTRLDPSSLHLEAAVNGVAADAVPSRRAVALTVPTGNARALVVTPLSPLSPGRYRLVAGAPPDTGLAGINGVRLGRDDAVVLTTFEVLEQP